MTQLFSYLKSRTVWTVIVTAMINGIPAVRDQIPAGVLPIVDAVLGILTIYFRVSPKQQF